MVFAEKIILRKAVKHLGKANQTEHVFLKNYERFTQFLLFVVVCLFLIRCHFKINGGPALS